MAILPKTIIR